MELLVKRKSDNKIFKVRKYIKTEQDESLWINDWYGHHVIGFDCEWEGNQNMEFIEWIFTGNIFSIGRNATGKIIAFNFKTSEQYDISGLFQYWLNNVKHGK